MKKDNIKNFFAGLSKKIKDFFAELKKTDRINHIFAGLMVAAFIGMPCFLESFNLFAGLWGCLAALLVGATKEWTDYLHIKKFDWMDFIATCIGMAIVMVFILLLYFGRG